MSDWDSSLVDPTTAPRDVSIIRSPGGRSGPLALENGAKLTFPWRRQQEISDSSPGWIYVDDDVPSNAERLRIYGPLVNPATRTDRSYVELGGSYTPNTDPGLTIKTTGGNGTLEAGVYLYQNTISWTASGGTPDVNFQALGGVVRWNAAQNKIVAPTTGATLPPALGLGVNHLFKVGSDTFTAGNYWLGMDGRYIQAYKDAGVASDLNLNPAGGAVTINGVDVSTPTGAWTPYTPTVTQGVARAVTVNHARYVKHGRTVTFTFLLTSTVAGSGATLTVSLPVAASVAGNRDVGGGHIYNGATNVLGVWSLNATTTVAMVISSGFYATALASGHAMTGTVTYEAAA